MDEIKIECKLESTNAKIPTRSRDTDAAFDLYAAETKTLLSGTLTPIKTDIKIAVPPGYYYTIESRSGMIKDGIFAMRGIIDAGYNGLVFVYLYNARLATELGGTGFKITKGDRIAQMIVHKMAVNPTFVEVDKFSEKYDIRGEKGWGSSGR